MIPSALIPGNWKGFLRVSENKKELFNFLACKTTALNIPGKILMSTQLQSLMTSPPTVNISALSPCSREEADTRLILHASDCVSRGFPRIMVRTTDTDVVVLAIANCTAVKAGKIWIVFGTGKQFKYIPIHKIVRRLGPERPKALPMLHAVTGCDTVSFFLQEKEKQQHGKSGVHIHKSQRHSCSLLQDLTS